MVVERMSDLKSMQRVTLFNESAKIKAGRSNKTRSSKKVSN
jgi:hypothetical protein